MSGGATLSGPGGLLFVGGAGTNDSGLDAGDGTVEDNGQFDLSPQTSNQDGVLKLKGKGKAGGYAAFVFDIGVPHPDAGKTYTLSYTADWSRLSNTGKQAFVGFGLLDTVNDDFHFAGVQGDGTTGLIVKQIEGDGTWKPPGSITETDGAAPTNGTQSGENFIQFGVTSDGLAYNFRTGTGWSAGLVSPADELTSVTSAVMGDIADVPKFGLAVYLPSTDTGEFDISVTLWETQADNEEASGPSAVETLIMTDSGSDTLRALNLVSGTWTAVGNTLLQTGIGRPGLAGLSTTTFALYDNGLQEIRTYSWDGSDFVQVGNGLAITGTSPTCTLCALSATRIAFANAATDRLLTYDFDGTDWAQVGNELAVTTVFPCITPLSATRVALNDYNTNTLKTFDFDGTDWAQVGNTLAVTGFAPSIAAMSSTRIARVIGSVSNQLRAFDFDGTDWAAVGNVFTDAAFDVSDIQSLVAIDGSRVVSWDAQNDDFHTLSFDGTDWTLVSSDSPTGATSMDHITGICALPDWILR